MKIADKEDGAKSGAVSDDAEKLREANKRIRLLEHEAQVMRRAVAYLSRDNNPKNDVPAGRELAARDVPIKVPVAVSCRVLNFSRQAYYQWAANPVPARDLEEAHLSNAIDHHREAPVFGYRLLGSENRILSVLHRRRWSGLEAGPPVHHDLIERHFSVTAPNRKWLTDITDRCQEKSFTCGCAIKDLHPNWILV